jgi:hypothetical protein
VTFPRTRRVATMADEERARLIASKISWLRGCPHQLPRIGAPATSSARLGVGPRADCRTTPRRRTTATGSMEPSRAHRSHLRKQPRRRCA